MRNLKKPLHYAGRELNWQLDASIKWLTDYIKENPEDIEIKNFQELLIVANNNCNIVFKKLDDIVTNWDWGDCTW
jgi:hypothetical protein